jgi:hypothetical protein
MEEQQILIRELKLIDSLHDFEGDRGGIVINDILDKVYNNVGYQSMQDFLDRINTPYLNKLQTNPEYKQRKFNKISLSSVESYNTESIISRLYGVDSVNNDDLSINIESIVNAYRDKTADEVLETVCGFNANIGSNKCQLFIPDSFRKPFFENAENKSKVNFLAEVIIKFFFRNKLQNVEERILFSTDSNAGEFSCIFNDIDQARSLADAAILGDSATGGLIDHSRDKPSEKDKGCMNLPRYKMFFNKKSGGGGDDSFPFPYTNSSETYEFSSNVFTSDIFKMFYINKTQVGKIPTSYAELINDIQFDVYNNTNDLLGSAYFGLFEGLTANSGDSVSTLKELINILTTSVPLDAKFDNALITDQSTLQTIRKKLDEVYNSKEASSTLKLTNIIIGLLQKYTVSNIIKLLLDYKRGGDYEQVNSAKLMNQQFPKSNIVLLTGDRLCSLYARTQKVPCVFIHYVKNKGYFYDLYSYSPTEDVNLNPTYKRYIDIYRKLKKYLDTVETVNPSLEKLKQGLEEYNQKLDGNMTPIDSLLKESIYGLLNKINTIIQGVSEIKSILDNFQANYSQLPEGYVNLDMVENDNDIAFINNFDTFELERKDFLDFLNKYDIDLTFDKEKFIRLLKTNKFNSLCLNISLSDYAELHQFINVWRKLIIDWNKMSNISDTFNEGLTRTQTAQLKKDQEQKKIFFNTQLPNILNRFNSDYTVFKNNLMSFYLDILKNRGIITGLSNEQRKWDYSEDDDISLFRNKLKQSFMDSGIDGKIEISDKANFEEMWSRIETTLYKINGLFEEDVIMDGSTNKYNGVGGILGKPLNIAENSEDQFNLYLLCEMSNILMPIKNESLNTIFEIMLRESQVSKEELNEYCKMSSSSLIDITTKVDVIFDTLINNNFIEYFQEYFYTERIAIIKVMLNGDVDNIQSRINTDYANFTSNGGTDAEIERIYNAHVIADFFKMFEEFSDMFTNRILYLVNNETEDITNIMCNASVFELSYKINQYMNSFLLQNIGERIFDDKFIYNTSAVVPFLKYAFTEDLIYREQLGLAGPIQSEASPIQSSVGPSAVGPSAVGPSALASVQSEAASVQSEAGPMQSVSASVQSEAGPSEAGPIPSAAGPILSAAGPSASEKYRQSRANIEEQVVPDMESSQYNDTIESQDTLSDLYNVQPYSPISSPRSKRPRIYEGGQKKNKTKKNYNIKKYKSKRKHKKLNKKKSKKLKLKIKKYTKRNRKV